jgi:hypothetical protein
VTGRTVSAFEVVSGIVVASGCAAAAVAGLVWLAKPAQFESRLLAARQQADTATQLLRRRPGQAALPLNALCGGPTAAAAEKLKTDLKGIAAAAQLDQVDVQVLPQLASDGGLIPLRVRIDATGPYEAVLGLFQRLSGLRPVVFIDTVDLGAKTSFVTLSLLGRVQCSAPQ